MSKNIRRIAIAVIAILSGGLSASAQKDNDWKERIMSEKIAFLTSEIGLTPQEAQAFWPVYNQVWESRGKAMSEIMTAFRNLDIAISKKDSKAIPALLDKYLESIRKKNDADEACDEKYRQVLSTEKVAKLYIAEEKFRRRQIHKLHGEHKH